MGMKHLPADSLQVLSLVLQECPYNLQAGSSFYLPYSPLFHVLLLGIRRQVLHELLQGGWVIQLGEAIDLFHVTIDLVKSLVHTPELLCIGPGFLGVSVLLEV